MYWTTRRQPDLDCVLYVNKYGFYVYLTSTLARYGRMVLFTSRDICLYYVEVNDVLVYGWLRWPHGFLISRQFELHNMFPNPLVLNVTRF